MKNQAFAAVLATFVTMIATVSAGAATFTLVDVTYDTTGILTGTFDYNAGVYSGVDITASGEGNFGGDVFDLLGTSFSNLLNVDSANHDNMTFIFALALPTTGSDAIIGGQLIQHNSNLIVPINDGGSVQAPLSATPLPAAFPLFAGGLGVMGMLGWRKKRKNAAAIAAA